MTERAVWPMMDSTWAVPNLPRVSNISILPRTTGTLLPHVAFTSYPSASPYQRAFHQKHMNDIRNMVLKSNSLYGNCFLYKMSINHVVHGTFYVWQGQDGSWERDMATGSTLHDHLTIKCNISLCHIYYLLGDNDYNSLLASLACVKITYPKYLGIFSHI